MIENDELEKSPRCEHHNGRHTITTRAIKGSKAGEVGTPKMTVMLVAKTTKDTVGTQTDGALAVRYAATFAQLSTFCLPMKSLLIH